MLLSLQTDRHECLKRSPAPASTHRFLQAVSYPSAEIAGIWSCYAWGLCVREPKHWRAGGLLVAVDRRNAAGSNDAMCAAIWVLTSTASSRWLPTPSCCKATPRCRWRGSRLMSCRQLPQPWKLPCDSFAPESLSVRSAQPNTECHPQSDESKFAMWAWACWSIKR